MAIQSEKDEELKEAQLAEAKSSLGVPTIVPETGEGEPPTGQLGSLRYVHAAFFVAGILIAYLSGKMLAAGWNQLADWPAAVRAVPQLISYPEEERDGLTLVAGAVIGTAAVVQIYRRETIRRWADDVAVELTKVSWPNRETVVNGTLVVVVASAIATVYVALLDRFWSFLTTLVYGA
jgi:preprotein translocase subunit SecE